MLRNCLKALGVGLVLAAVSAYPALAAFKLKGEPKIAMIIFSQKNDGGWSQALDEARQRLEKSMNVKIPVVENVPENATAIRPAVELFINKGYNIITLDEYEDMGRAAAIEKINSVVGDGPFYISLDIDSIDPTYAPGTAVPEIGGLLPRDLQVIIRSLQGKDLIGADISEVAPVYDPTGITCITAANMMFEILCIMAKAVEKSR